LKKPSKVFRYVILGTTLILFGGAMAQDALQTQYHDTLDGLEVDLVKLDVQNSILTMRFRVRHTGESKVTWQFNYSDCYIMDETNQKKYSALKDSDGLYIAGPVYDKNNGGRFWFDFMPGQTKGIWIKFPEPTDGPEAITISLPNVSPFDAVKMK